MTILDTIIAHKLQEVAEAKTIVSIRALEKMPLFKMPGLSLKKNLLSPDKTGIIAEYKRKSPSKGVINNNTTVQEVTTAYAQYGASGISVLTDSHFFGGSLLDLAYATPVQVPLLRKDFVVEEYQLLEAKAHGASVVLLIAACLSPVEVVKLASVAKNLGLEVLLEIHNHEELAHICDEVDMVGVNNRNLKNFVVDLEASEALFHEIPKEKLAIAESGISSVDTLLFLRKIGFKGFLIGEHFMKQSDPTLAFAEFASNLKKGNV